MAHVRSPNIDFTIGTAGNRIQMSAEADQAATDHQPSVTGYTIAVQPTLSTTGGDSVVAYPICG